MLEAGAGNHVADTLPDLVEAVDTGFAAALEQCLELRWRRPEHNRRHDVSLAHDRPRVSAFDPSVARSAGDPRDSDQRQRGRPNAIESAALAVH